MRNYYFARLAFKSLVLLTILVGLSGTRQLVAQSISNSDLTVPDPVLSVCFQPGEFGLKILKGAEAQSAVTLSIVMPEGFRYESGTAKIDGISIDQANESISVDGLTITLTLDIPASGSSGDALEITFEGMALCSAITGAMDGDAPQVNYALTLSGESDPIDTQESDALNIQWAVFNLSAVPSIPAAGIGEEVVNTITLRNSGTGSINSFTFEIERGAGLEAVGDPVFPVGWTPSVISSQDGVYVYLVVADDGVVLEKEGGELVITERVRVKSCDDPSTGLSTTYQAYYGCEERCSLQNVDAETSIGIFYELAGAPVITRTATDIPTIDCLDTSYKYGVTYTNQGTATATDARIRVHIGNASNGTGSAGLAGYIVDNSVKYRIILEDGSTEDWKDAEILPDVGAKHSKPAFGFNDEYSWLEAKVDDLPPGAKIEVRYEVYYAQPDPDQCATIDAAIYLPGTSTRFSFINQAECPVPTAHTLTNHQSLKAPVRYALNPTHQGEVDVISGQVFQIDAMLGLSIPSSTDFPIANDGYFDLILTLSPELAPPSLPLSADDVYLDNFGQKITFDQMDQIGPNSYRLRINKSNSFWGDNLDLTLARLVFNTEVNCTGSANPFYTIGGELTRRLDCPPITLKCTTVQPLNALCDSPGPGDCVGIDKGRPFLQRVNYGFHDTNNNGIGLGVAPSNADDARSKGMNVRAFVGEELVELGHHGTVSGGAGNKTWKKGTVTFSTPAGMTFSAQYGKIILKRGTTQTFTADQVDRVITGTNQISFNFESTDLRDEGGNPVDLDFEFQDGDEITASVIFKVVGFPNTAGHKTFPADIYLTEDGDPHPYKCGFDYTASGIYARIHKHVVNQSGGNGNIIADCENVPTSIEVGLRVNGSNNDPVFYNEYRTFADFDKVNITIPEGLELVGVRVHGTILSNSLGSTSSNHASARFLIPGGPVTGSYEFDLKAHVTTINEADPQGTGAYGKEGGFTAIVAPIFSPICVDPASASQSSGAVTMTSTMEPGIFFEGSPGSFGTHNHGTRTINYNNNTLTLNASDLQPEPLNNTVTWNVRVQNSSSARVYSNFWFGLDHPNMKITEVVQVANSGAETTVPVVGGIAQVGTYTTGANFTFRITAEYENCTSAVTNLVWGSACGDDVYPASVEGASCVRGDLKNLSFKAPAPAIQTEMVIQPASPHDICAPMEFGVRLRNSGNAVAEKLSLTIPKTSLNFDRTSVYVTYPYVTGSGGGNGVQLLEAGGLVIEETDTYVRLELPQTYKLAAGEQLLIEFSVQADPCGFVSGQRFSFTPSATNRCGDLLSSLQVVTSNRIKIDGAPIDEPTLKIESSVSNVRIMPEGEGQTNVVEALYNFKLTNTGALDAGDEYNVKVALPEHWVLSNVEFQSNPVGASSAPSFSNGVYTFDNWTGPLVANGVIEFTAKISLPSEHVGLLACGETIHIYENAGTTVNLGAACAPAGCSTIEHVVAENFTTSFTIPIPSTPSIDAVNQEFCDAEIPASRATLANLSNTLNGESLRHHVWYGSASSTTPLPAHTVLTNGTTYYVRNHLNTGSTCRSEALAVTVTINPLVAQVGTSQTLCIDEGYQLTFTVTGTAPVILSGTVGDTGTWVNNGDGTHTYTSNRIDYDVNYSLTVGDGKSCNQITIMGEAPICYLGISGNVLNDVNGLTDNLVNGVGLNEITDMDGQPIPLFVNLLDKDGVVLASMPVNSDGSYDFPSSIERILPNNNYSIQLSTHLGVEGAAPPAADLPENWVNTGEHIGIDVGNDGAADGVIAVNVSTRPVANVNLAIEELPTAIGSSAPSQINPGGINEVLVPSNIFRGTDPHGGIIESIIITEFPTNVTSIRVNGVLYRSLTDFPLGGIVIPTDATGQPSVPVFIDPLDGDPTVNGGNIVVEIPFWVVDNAGESSLVPSTAVMPFEGRQPEISVVKSASSPSTYPVEGEVITYTFVVTNEGNVPLYNVTLLDFDFDGNGTNPLVPIRISTSDGSPVGTLLVGETATYEVDYALVQKDIDQGELNNNIRATGEDHIPGLDPIPVSDEDVAEVILPHNPLIEITKEADFKGDKDRAEVDDEIEYTFVVTNKGNVTLTNITIADKAFSGTGDALVLTLVSANPAEGDPVSGLAPGGTLTYTATYAITQADIDAGEVINQALVTGTPPATSKDPNPTPITDLSDDPNDSTDVDPDGDGNPDDPTIVPLGQDPLVEITKAGVYTGDPNRAEVGDLIEYTFVVTNMGNVTLSNVEIDEDTLFEGFGVKPDLSAPVASDGTSTEAALAPYATLTYTASYALTQEDIDNGEVVNQAIVSGTPPGNPQDPNPGPIEDHSDDPNDPTDVDPDGDGEPDDPTIIPLPQDPLVELTKSSVYTGDPNRAEVGDIIEYTFVVTNTGNVTLHDVEVDETMFTGSGTHPVLSAPVANPSSGNSAAALAPYATLTYTATYVITQDDINAGEVVNQAIVRGTPPGNPQDPNPGPIEDHSDDPNDPTDVDPDGDGNPDDPTVTPLPQMPLIDLQKSAVNHGDVNNAQVGDRIDYTFVLTNTGNVTLRDVSVQDDVLFSGTGTKPVLSAPVGDPSYSSESVLHPGATLTYTAFYEITQDDINAGHVTNQALASGTPPGTDTPIEDHSDDPNDPTDVDPDGDGNPDDPTVVDLGQNPGLELLKDGVFDDNNGDGIAQPGETITYTFTVNNTGNVKLTDLVIDDARIGVTGLAVTPGTLNPGEQGEATFSYAITQSDIDEGGVWNIATVTGKDPKGGDVKDDSEDPTPLDPNDDSYDPECPDCTVTPLPQGPDFTITKTADKARISEAGEVITYTITIRNTGNTTLQNIVVTDVLFPDWTDTIQTLLPGASQSFELKYTVTQEDIDSGSVLNVAKATAEDPDGDPLDPKEDEKEVPVTQTPNFDITKTADKTTISAPGEVITYTITVRNTGNTTLQNVVITDVLFPDWSETIQTMLPGASQSFELKYTVTQEDIDSGSVLNVAKATAEDPDGKPLDPKEDEEEVPVANMPAMEVTKTADKVSVSASGDVITYTIMVRNTGNVTLSNVRIVDPLTGMNETIVRLGVGESRSFTTSYTVTGDDLRNGLVRNVVKATGEDPSGKPVEDDDTVDVPVENCVFRIPNIFTPNGDGINDLFVIEGIECLDRVEVLIFNRWGNEVYRSDNYRNDWAGLNLNDGVYYYLINTHESGSIKVHRGWVVLKRD